MAQVELIDYTGKGHPLGGRRAAHLLIFTKNTRLNMTPELVEEIEGWPDGKIISELDYMATTIPSSWEFVDLTFLISNVTRACAQQITRTRTGSYAMQSQRVTNASEMDVVNPCEDYGMDAFMLYADTVETVNAAYGELVDHHGVKLGDARGILPMNTTCNLVAKYNLRSFVELMRARSSIRVQGEYSDIADQMRERCLDAWPWAAPFFRSKNQAAIDLLAEVIDEVGLEVGAGIGWKLAKVQDLLR